jgi:hypothetical protein
VLAMLAALTRETGLLLPLALVSDRCFRRDWRGAVQFAASGIPAAVWYGYVAARLPLDKSATVIGIPAWGLLQRLLLFRSYPDPRVQLLLRVTDVLAVLGLIACILLAVSWLRKRGLAPVPICVGVFACLALVLRAPVLVEAFAFGRPVSPLLLWIMIEAVDRKTWSALAPPLSISFSVSLAFARPFVEIAKAVVGR